MNDVPLVYADTSALGALLVAQSETEALVAWLDEAQVRLVSSDLLETELRRMAMREGREQEKVSAILDGVSIAALDRAAYRSAGFLPMRYLRTLDALHLEAAIRLDVEAILTYDVRLGDAARAAGLGVIAPGAAPAACPLDVDKIADDVVARIHGDPEESPPRHP